MTSANFHLSATRSLRAGLAAIAGLIAISAANVADAAAQPADAPALLVRFTDLNIMTEQGASSLYRRIALAARRVCPQADIRDLKGLRGEPIVSAAGGCPGRAGREQPAARRIVCGARETQLNGWRLDRPGLVPNESAAALPFVARPVRAHGRSSPFR